MAENPIASGRLFAGRYLLVRQMKSRGGQGVTWLARTEPDGDTVVVKLFAAGPMDRGRRVANREERLLRKLANCANVPGLIERGHSDGHHFIVLDFIDGPNLEELRVKEGGRLRGDLLELAAEGSLAALGACAAARVTHNDIKPANLVLDLKRKLVSLIDFGVGVSLDAPTTQPEIGRTPLYMSPEYGLRTPPHVSDVYSWALTMVHLASGHTAFPVPWGEGAYAAMAGIFATRSPEPDLSGVPAWLRDLCVDALRWDSKDRPSATALLVRLRSSLSCDVATGAHATRPSLPLPRRNVASAGRRAASLVALLVAFVRAHHSSPAAASVLGVAAAAGLVGRSLWRSGRARKGWRLYKDRWRQSGEGEGGLRLPFLERVLLACLAVGILVGRVASTVPASSSATRALVVLLGTAAVITVSTSALRTGLLRHSSLYARLGVPLLSIAPFLACLQLRDLGVTHVELVGRLVPWWVVFAAASGAAVWIGLGMVAERSRPMLVALICLGLGSLMVGLAWVGLARVGDDRQSPWSLFSPSVRFAVVLLSALAVSALAGLGARGLGRRLAAVGTSSAGLSVAVLLLWWVGLIPGLDNWIERHLPDDFIGWDHEVDPDTKTGEVVLVGEEPEAGPGNDTDA